MPKTFALTIVLLFCAILGAAQKTKEGAKGVPQKGPCDAAATQLELNQCYGEQFRKADARLNKICASLLKQLRSGTAATTDQRIEELKGAYETGERKLE